jgi:hypothetical protein
VPRTLAPGSLRPRPIRHTGIENPGLDVVFDRASNVRPRTSADPRAQGTATRRGIADAGDEIIMAISPFLPGKSARSA